MRHLRYTHLSEPELRRIFLDIIWKTPDIKDALIRVEELDLPNWRIVSGALYNVVWNHLTDRPAMHGVKDIDLFYFDSDTSWESEDAAIQKSIGFSKHPPIEIRNQARVHLWYEQHFGHKIPPLTSVEEAIDVFACKTHSVGVHLKNNTLDLYAPYGLRDIFALRLIPNPLRNNRATHEAKAKRALKFWPELTVESWQQHIH